MDDADDGGGDGNVEDLRLSFLYIPNPDQPPSSPVYTLIPLYPRTLILSYPDTLIPLYPYILIPLYPHMLTPLYPHIVMPLYPFWFVF